MLYHRVVLRVHSCMRSWLLVFLSSALFLTSSPAHPLGIQHLTPMACGKLHVHGNLLLDDTGQVIVLKGAELEELGHSEAAISATTFSTIRQRWNMNAIRLPVNPATYVADATYRKTLNTAVATANKLELLVIVSAQQASAQFWRECADETKDRTGVLYELGDPALIASIRSRGAEQPILLFSNHNQPGPGTDVLLEFSFRFGDQRPSITAGYPIVMNIQEPTCPPPGTDPGVIEEMVDRDLTYLDSQNASWIVRAFVPGQLILNYDNFDGSRLESGFACEGSSLGSNGIGLAVQFHLWNTRMLGLFTVSGPTGSFVLPRGGLAIAYGPILGTSEGGTSHGPLPTTLGGMSIRVTDSRGKARLAGIIYVFAGWGQANFVVPDESAVGPAEISIERSDGSVATGPAIIADVAPGLSGKAGNGRGPATGQVFQTETNGRRRTMGVCSCEGIRCWTNPILLSATTETTVRLVGNGFRHIKSPSDIEATIGGVRVPVVANHPGPDPGLDQITLSLPITLQGLGESDVIISAAGHVSNVVRIRIQ
jgi:uncharacterized protein (TIGR03437 family)